MARISVAAALVALAAIFAAPASAATFSGQATALHASVLGISSSLGDTGALPSNGGTQNAALANVNVLGIVKASGLQAATSGTGSTASSNASVASASLALLGVSLTGVQSQSQATCSGTTPSTSGSSQVASLTILGQQLVNVTTPNLAVPLALGYTLTLNETTSSTSGNTGSITVNAVHLAGPGVDVAVASSHSDITC